MSDAGIYAIAHEIRRAVRCRTYTQDRPNILSVRYELRPSDEDRVEVALVVLNLIEGIR